MITQKYKNFSVSKNGPIMTLSLYTTFLILINAYLILYLLWFLFHCSIAPPTCIFYDRASTFQVHISSLDKEYPNDNVNFWTTSRLCKIQCKQSSKASSRINKFGITNLIYFLLLPLRHFCREDKVAIFVKKQKQKTIKAIKVLSKLTR